jgi:serine/threonine-protein kinase
MSSRPAIGDRYDLLFPIAHGGMGEVWMGRRGRDLVVIKRLAAKLARDEAFRSLFRTEARIALAIHHPNVARVFDFGEAGDELFLVLEWVRGDSLSALRRALRLREEPMPLPIALRIVADACAGLHAAHELRSSAGHPLGLVHRDVSPANILLDVSGGVKLIDFGLAAARSSEAVPSAGTRAYMAPEQARGDDVDRRADVWAAGAVLERLCRSATDAPSTPGGPPLAVRSILERALARDPDDRYPTAHALQRDLEHAARGLAAAVTAGDVGAFVERYFEARVESLRALAADKS